MGYIIIPASSLEGLEELDLNAGQVAIFGDTSNDGNVTMVSITGQVKDLAEGGDGGDGEPGQVRPLSEVLIAGNSSNGKSINIDNDFGNATFKGNGIEVMEGAFSIQGQSGETVSIGTSGSGGGNLNLHNNIRMINIKAGGSLETENTYVKVEAWDTTGSFYQQVGNQNTFFMLGGLVLPQGTGVIGPEGRPDVEFDGIIRYNQSDKQIEGKVDGEWVSLNESGDGGSNITYGENYSIPFVNSGGTGFSYVNSNQDGFGGKLEWSNEMLEVRSGLGHEVPVASINNLTETDYTARFRKSYQWSSPKSSLAIRRDGTVEIGEWNNTSYQNALSLHYMSDAAIEEMKNDEYFSKIYVSLKRDLHFKDDDGKDSILNVWKEKTDGTSRFGIYDDRGIIELNYYADNIIGSDSQYSTFIGAAGAKIGTNAAGSDSNWTFSNSLILSSGSAKFANKGKVNNSILIGSSSEIEEGSHNCVIGQGSKVLQRIGSNGSPITTGGGSADNTILGAYNQVRGTNLVAIGRSISIMDNLTNGEAIQSVAIGHGLSARASGQYLFGNSFHTQNAKVPLIAFDLHYPSSDDSANSNSDPAFTLFRGIDAGGNQTDNTTHPDHEYNRDTGINILMGPRSGRTETVPGNYGISQYSGEGVFMMSTGHNQLAMVEPSGKIDNIATFYPYQKKGTGYQWDASAKTGIKFKSEGEVNSESLASIAGYHFLGQTLVANGGHNAEEHVDTNVGLVAVGKGNDESTSSIKSKNLNGDSTFEVKDNGIVVFSQLTFSELPPAGDIKGGQVFLTTGGSETNVMVFSNGTKWVSLVSGSTVNQGEEGEG